MRTFFNAIQQQQQQPPSATCYRTPPTQQQLSAQKGQSSRTASGIRNCVTFISSAPQMKTMMTFVLMMVAAGCTSAAIIPNLMFARPAPAIAAGHHGHGQQRINNDAEMAYGAMFTPDRHHSAAEAAAAAAAVASIMAHQQQPSPPVYGVARHYLSDPAPAATYYDPTEELYNDPLLFRRASRWPASKPRNTYALPASYYYDDDQDDVMDVDRDADADAMDDGEPISRQDVVNFEKYVQRFFQQQQQAGQDVDAYDGPEEFNDEEAARQLHLLLNQQRRSPDVREIRKRKMSDETTTAPTTTTTMAAASTTATTATTTAATESFHQQGGQKEEAMLRPPTPGQQRPVMPIETTTAATSTVEPDGDKDDDVDIYRAIHRLVAMRNQLDQKVKCSDSVRQSSNET